VFGGYIPIYQCSGQTRDEKTKIVGFALYLSPRLYAVIRLARSFAPPGTQGPPTLTPPAFNALWQYLSQWYSIFISFDADRSGRISHSELQNALAAFGIRLPPRLVHLMIHKQNLMQGKIQKGRRLPDDIDFPSFIDLCITCKQATDTFGRLDTNQSGSVQMYWENYMDIIVSGR
jgi:hypothetical protein